MVSSVISGYLGHKFIRHYLFVTYSITQIISILLRRCYWDITTALTVVRLQVCKNFLSWWLWNEWYRKWSQGNLRCFLTLYFLVGRNHYEIVERASTLEFIFTLGLLGNAWELVLIISCLMLMFALFMWPIISALWLLLRCYKAGINWARIVRICIARIWSCIYRFIKFSLCWSLLLRLLWWHWCSTLIVSKHLDRSSD